jgi:hypothetical protein
VRLTARRTSGDLRPAACLYRGTETSLSPDELAAAEELALDYTIAEGGEHHVAVRAWRGEGTADFELTATCTGGTCDGSEAPSPRADDAPRSRSAATVVDACA